MSLYAYLSRLRIRSARAETLCWSTCACHWRRRGLSLRPAYGFLMVRA